MTKHIQPHPEAGKKFYQDFKDEGKIVKLNLLRFRAVADIALEALTPQGEVSGEDAYRRYMESTLPELKKAGGRILCYVYMLECNDGTYYVGDTNNLNHYF